MLLRKEDCIKSAIDVEELRAASLSDDSAKQKFFRTEITQNKWYWLGMGTIADICHQDRDLRKQFREAYLRLAISCKDEGLASIYSERIIDIFGKWIEMGIA